MMKRMLLCLFFASYVLLSYSQNADVVVDKNGVMRWKDSKQEVMGFGVNYTVPFAHAYRSAKRMGVDVERAIDQDVYHFARLGFDAYRVHVWDTEISDTLGNLLENEHLRAFDYLLMRLKERGIRCIITPIAYWGNGWPEPDDPTPGFARKYGKGDCLVNEDAIKAQERYLSQFVSHVNSYTKIAYKDDPYVVAFEISNEPHHRGTPESVTRFINLMSDAIRSTGCKKPIFYNVSHSVQLGKAYFDSRIQGGTFQWYPTGLGARHELRGNFLPNVDRYKMPFDDVSAFRKRAKIVYEFDAADVGRSYIYPAIARSFRTAGIQWATHFAYDPTYLAPFNTEYNTHYMNLVYAPQKALSLKIASAVFHRVPMYKDYGSYPANSTFDKFRVSYEEDLAELIDESTFYYTNNTKTKVSPDKLKEIAGFGNSSVVSYDGKGAYFLDQVEPGIWRLEVMPDAIWIDNLFGRNSPDKTVAVLKRRTSTMKIQLPDIGNDFAIEAINQGNNSKVVVSENEFGIQPGTYMVYRKGVTKRMKGTEKFKSILLNEFAAPPSSVAKVYLLHEPWPTLTKGTDLKLEATVVGQDDSPKVSALVFAGGRPQVIELKPNGYNYSGTVPASSIQDGLVRYHLIVEDGGKITSYPAGINKKPSDWDFYADETYDVSVLDPSQSLTLFDASTDTDELSREWRRGSSIQPLNDRGESELIVSVEKLFAPDPEDANKASVHDYSMRYNFTPKLHGRRAALSGKRKIVMVARSLDSKPLPVQVAIITKQGQTYGAMATLNLETGSYEVPLSDLKPVSMVTLPRPYPTFLDYYFNAKQQTAFVLEDAETFQISIGPGLTGEELNQPHSFALQRITLE